MHYLYMYTYTYSKENSMPAKTIYVSAEDQDVFDLAQEIAGEKLSSVIARALKEFVAKKQSLAGGMKEISVQVGTTGVQSEKRFHGRLLLKWTGLSEDKKRWLQAKVYKTSKDNLAVEIIDSPHPDFWRQREFWKYNDAAEFMPQSLLLILKNIDEAAGKLPSALIMLIEQADSRDESPVEFLDI